MPACDASRKALREKGGDGERRRTGVRYGTRRCTLAHRQPTIRKRLATREVAPRVVFFAPADKSVPSPLAFYLSPLLKAFTAKESEKWFVPATPALRKAAVPLSR